MAFAVLAKARDGGHQVGLALAARDVVAPLRHNAARITPSAPPKSGTGGQMLFQSDLLQPFPRFGVQQRLRVSRSDVLHITIIVFGRDCTFAFPATARIHTFQVVQTGELVVYLKFQPIREARHAGTVPTILQLVELGFLEARMAAAARGGLVGVLHSAHKTCDLHAADTLQLSGPIERRTRSRICELSGSACPQKEFHDFHGLRCGLTNGLVQGASALALCQGVHISFGLQKPLHVCDGTSTGSGV